MVRVTTLTLPAHQLSGRPMAAVNVVEALVLARQGG
jgi:hypothetical protein